MYQIVSFELVPCFLMHSKLSTDIAYIDVLVLLLVAVIDIMNKSSWGGRVYLALKVSH